MKYFSLMGGRYKEYKMKLVDRPQYNEPLEYNMDNAWIGFINFPNVKLSKFDIVVAVECHPSFQTIINHFIIEFRLFCYNCSVVVLRQNISVAETSTTLYYLLPEVARNIPTRQNQRITKSWQKADTWYFLS